MSQIYKGVYVVRELADVQEACRTRGWGLRQGGRLRWYRTQEGRECDWTVEFSDQEVDRYGQRLNKKYNIGLARNAQGTFDVVHDNAMNGAETPEAGRMDDTTQRVIGAFRQAVARAAIVRQNRAVRRSIVRQEVLANGTIRIVTE